MVVNDRQVPHTHPKKATVAPECPSREILPMDRTSHNVPGCSFCLKQKMSRGMGLQKFVGYG